MPMPGVGDELEREKNTSQWHRRFGQRRYCRIELTNISTSQVAVYGVPREIRTPVAAVKGRCPGPLDDGDLKTASKWNLVELGGIEPPTSCMPCKRSPS